MKLQSSTTTSTASTTTSTSLILHKLEADVGGSNFMVVSDDFESESSDIPLLTRIEAIDVVFIVAIIVAFLMIVAVVCRFTIRMATPMNSAASTPVIDIHIREEQCTWADRELLYLQRGPLLADD